MKVDEAIEIPGLPNSNNNNNNNNNNNKCYLARVTSSA